ncbi:unnamed protein product [Linum trigynum]|uniref:Luciferase-like domain-containing protein n=1 Tax=Linum trigynum TaxID=586398 RepID=A0AAV2DYC6_9ROSI
MAAALGLDIDQGGPGGGGRAQRCRRRQDLTGAPGVSEAAMGAGEKATAAALGQVTTERMGRDASELQGGIGLLSTPTTEEIAEIHGKAKVLGYDNVVQNPCFMPLGPRTQVEGARQAGDPNWLGWLGMGSSPIGD